MVTQASYRWVDQPCPICETRPTEYLGRRGGSAHRQGAGTECAIWRCRQCGLVFPNPMPYPLDGLGQHYDLDPDEYFSQHDPTSRLAGAMTLLGDLESKVGHKGALLDVGSGRGETLLAASRLGWSVTGIEPSARFAERAAAYSGVTEIRREPIERCDFPPESFDAVLLQAILEHLYNPDEVMRAVARCLKPGGVVYADVPNERGLYTRLGNIYQRLRGRDWVVSLSPTFSPYHVFGFGPESLRKLYRKHGLEPLRFVVGGGKSSLPAGGGIAGRLEGLAAAAVSDVSNAIGMGTYVASWARKSVAPATREGVTGRPR